MSHQIASAALSTNIVIQDDTAAETEKINQLIARLGDSDHLVRTQSQSKLLKIGEPAIGPLQTVLNFEDSAIVPDNEIRLSATRLLILIQREVHQRKLAEFLDGTRDEIELEGWTDFRELLGSKKQTRRLFTKAHKVGSELFKAPVAGKLKTENLLHQTISSRIKLSSLGNAESILDILTAVMFAATRETRWQTDQPASAPTLIDFDVQRIHRVLLQPHMVKTINGHSSGTEIKALISRWIDSRQIQTAGSKHQGKSLANSISIIEAYQLANQSELVLQCALNTELSAHVRSSALGALSRIGTPQTIPRMATLLNDSTIVGEYLLSGTFERTRGEAISLEKRPLLKVQIRDVALATSAILSGSSPDQFGFKPQSFSNSKLVIKQAGFATDAERSQALDRWKKQTENPASTKQRK